MIERVHLRLCVWAEEVAGGLGASSTGSVLGALIDGAASQTKLHKRKRVLFAETGELVDPVLSVEATATRARSCRAVGIRTSSMDVDEAILKLSRELVDVVKVFYFEGDLAAKVRANKLNISVATMYRRRDAAHVLLDAYLHGADAPRVSHTYPQKKSQR